MSNNERSKPKKTFYELHVACAQAHGRWLNAKNDPRVVQDYEAALQAQQEAAAELDAELGGDAEADPE